MHDLVGRELTYNAESRDRWKTYADHRAKVTKLLQLTECADACEASEKTCREMVKHAHDHDHRAG